MLNFKKLSIFLRNRGAFLKVWMDNYRAHLSCDAAYAAYQGEQNITICSINKEQAVNDKQAFVAILQKLVVDNWYYGTTPAQLSKIEELERLYDAVIYEYIQDYNPVAYKAEDEEQECYIMEDGEKVFVPITEEDFCESLYIDGFTMNFKDGWDKPFIDLYLCCSPDYFAYHCIHIMIDDNKNVICNGLAG